MPSNKIGGYKALPLRFSAESSAEHTIFIKEHSSKQHVFNKPKGKTLFVANVPPYATKRSLQLAFREAGLIKNVVFENDEGGFKTAYLIFNKTESLHKALKLDNLKPLCTDQYTIETGVSKWILEYNNSLEDEDKLKQRIEQVVKEYDENEKTKKSEGDGGKDEDGGGWTVVTKASRTPGLSRKESLKNKLNEKRMKKHKQLTNFYTFQIRESKKNHIANLRKKYEEDKKKVEALKQARKFKPF